MTRALVLGGLIHGLGKSLRFRASFLAAMILLPAAANATAQAGPPVEAASAAPAGAPPLPEAPPSHLQDSTAVTVRNTPMHVVKDQEAIWTSPARIRSHHLVWLLPLAGATAATLATDHRAMRDVVSHNPQFNHNCVDASNAALAALVAVPVVSLAYGAFGEHPHARESGILGAETLVDAAILEQGMKLMFWRERPAADRGNGRFWQSGVGVDSSFPSSHTVFAWSTAAVIAGEHPAPWSQFAVYTLATGVSVSRVLGQEHFPSDVLVGSAAGWLAGHYVYKVRHRWQRRNR